MLPKNEKVNRVSTDNINMYVYGRSLIGKTVFSSGFPDPLMINTDGNIKYVDTPAVSPSNWTEFKGYVDDIIKGNHDFKTIVVDLLEDVYTMARIHYYKELGITHESDLGYAKAYDIIRTDYLATMVRLTQSPYNIVFISHESEKTVKTRTGIEKTHYVPNLSEKVANKIAGMCEIVSRFVIEYDETDETEKRYIRLTANEDEFGGNRPTTITTDKIEAKYEKLIEILA